MAGTGPALPGACAPAARQAVGSEPDAGPRGLSGAERQTKPGRLRATRGPRCREDGQGKRPQGAGRLAEIWARRRRRLCRREVDVAPRFRVPLCPGRPRAGPHRRDRDGLAHRPLSEACAERATQASHPAPCAELPTAVPVWRGVFGGPSCGPRERGGHQLPRDAGHP